MKRSFSDLEFERIECVFVHALTGEIYNFKKPCLTKYWDPDDRVSALITCFCRSTGLCMYQVKLLYNDIPLNKNQTLRDQCDTTPPIMTFKVIKNYNEIIDVKDFKYDEVKGETTYFGNTEIIEWVLKLPKVRKFSMEFKSNDKTLIFRDVEAFKINFHGAQVSCKYDPDNTHVYQPILLGHDNHKITHPYALKNHIEKSNDTFIIKIEEF